MDARNTVLTMGIVLSLSFVGFVGATPSAEAVSQCVWDPVEGLDGDENHQWYCLAVQDGCIEQWNEAAWPGNPPDFENDGDEPGKTVCLDEEQTSTDGPRTCQYKIGEDEEDRSGYCAGVYQGCFYIWGDNNEDAKPQAWEIIYRLCPDAESGANPLPG